MVDNSANYCLNKLDLDTEILSMYEDIEKKGLLYLYVRKRKEFHII